MWKENYFYEFSLGCHTYCRSFKPDSLFLLSFPRFQGSSSKQQQFFINYSFTAERWTEAEPMVDLGTQTIILVLLGLFQRFLEYKVQPKNSKKFELSWCFGMLTDENYPGRTCKLTNSAPTSQSILTIISSLTVFNQRATKLSTPSNYL